MPAKNFDDLAARSAISGDEVMPLRTNGSTLKTTIAAIAAFANATNNASSNAQVTALASDLNDFASSVGDVLNQLAAAVGQNTTDLVGLKTNDSAQDVKITNLNSLILPPGSAAPAFSAPPTITGTLTVGSSLTLHSGTVSGTIIGSDFTLKNGNAIIYGPGPATTYVVQPTDGTATLTLTQTVHSAFPDVSATSIGYVIGSAPAVPEQTSPATISGNAAEGQTLTGADGTASNTPTGIDRQWVSGAAMTPIPGATNQTYAIPAGSAGLQIRYGVRAKNGAGSALVWSYSDPVVVSGSVAPSYTAAGAVPPGYVYQAAYQVGTPMVVDLGLAPGADPTLAIIQHYAAGAPITGAVGMSFTPTAAQGDKQMSVGVIPRNGANQAGAEVRSAAVWVSP